MKKLISLIAIIILIGIFADSTNKAPEGLEANEPTTQVRLEKKLTREYWFGDYMPLNPQWYGIRTYEYLYTGEQFTSMIVGTETVPYLTGAITGAKIVHGDSSVVFYTEKKRLWWLKEDDYYLSTDCELTAYPPNKIHGKVYDGEILDMSDPVYKVKDDFSDCIPFPILPGDSWVWLVQIQDVFIHGKRYNNALILWELEPGMDFKGCDFYGYEQVMGITLPTANETNNWAIDDFLIFGFHRGILAHGDISLDEGELGFLWELISISRYKRY